MTCSGYTTATRRSSCAATPSWARPCATRSRATWPTSRRGASPRTPRATESERPPGARTDAHAPRALGGPAPRRAGALPGAWRAGGIRADDGCPARRPRLAGAAGEAHGRARRGEHLREPPPVRADRGFLALRAADREGPRAARARGRGPPVGADRAGRLPARRPDARARGGALGRARGCVPTRALHGRVHGRGAAPERGPPGRDVAGPEGRAAGADPRAH